MGYTNETTHYGIPLPLGSDLTTPMDYNTAAEAVDEAVFEAVSNSSGAVDTAAEAVQTANAATTAAAGAVTEAQTAHAVADAATTAAGTAQATANAAQSAVADLAEDVSQTVFVEITADGVKTISELLNAVYSGIPSGANLRNTKLRILQTNGDSYYTSLYAWQNDRLVYTDAAVVTNGNRVESYTIMASGSKREAVSALTTGTTYQDRSSEVMSAGIKLAIIR